MTAPLLMVGATLLFAVMGVCIKLAADLYSVGEIVFYRGVIGALFIAAGVRLRGGTLRTAVPMMHFWRGAIGVTALTLWFYALMTLPLATAVTLNYMSSVWMAVLLIGGAAWSRQPAGVDGRLVTTVLVGFAGVAMVLRPTLAGDQLWAGLAGLLSGLLAAMAYLQVTALGRVGEPEYRVVFYFSLCSLAVGALTMPFFGLHRHTAFGVLLLLGVGLPATLAQMLLTRAYSIGRTLSNASLQYLGIVFSSVFGVLLFDERVTAIAVAGMLLIVASGLAATLLRARQPAEAACVDTPPQR